VNWKPLWPSKQATRQDLLSVQPEAFTYDEVPFDLKHELEILLKNNIIARMMDDRSQYITRWNIECDRRLYSLLDSIEVDQDKENLGKSHEREIHDLLGMYEASQQQLLKNLHSYGMCSPSPIDLNPFLP
jgi:hypothetical protein